MAPVVSHLTCVGLTRDAIKSILDTYVASGIENILALRGDPPQGQGPFEPVDGGFKYTFEMVEFTSKKALLPPLAPAILLNVTSP
ncbi:MAG: methylenetetrahydrofolate reductase (NADPH) [Desulforhopalus sp.]|jgi:methylenetetrahydrofolate reductase (NADPH)